MNTMDWTQEGKNWVAKVKHRKAIIECPGVLYRVYIFDDTRLRQDIGYVDYWSLGAAKSEAEKHLRKVA